jgi:aspartyl-tRNA(Asn)/glutamyl-tRNA(Gln) amidotransferase subunit B
MTSMHRGFEAVIGLECHARLATASKMFCRCPVTEDAPPNAAVCPVCLGHPGTLPTVNEAAVAMALRAALALGATIHTESQFARKNYFYPDLPKGYQISQFDRPLATGGTLHVRIGEEIRSFGLRRIHLEEDAGKMLHSRGGTHVDWNRAGVPLIEIVGEADIASADAAEAWLRMLHRVLVESGVCSGDMEKGHFRCDANVSVRRRGEPLGTRTEVKNVNSFRFVARALRHEIERQIDVLETGGTVEQQTRTWTGQRTALLRRKEESSDYRYFPEPDLPRLELRLEEIERQRAVLLHVPFDLHLLAIDQAERDRWKTDYGLDPAAVEGFSEDPALVVLFRDAVAAGGAPVAMARWLRNDVLRWQKQSEHAADSSREEGSESVAVGFGRLLGRHLAKLQALVDEGRVSLSVARQLLDDLCAHGGEVEALVVNRGLAVVSDEAELRGLVLELVAQNPVQVRKYRAGNANMLGFFMGEVMRCTRGQADPPLSRRLIEEVLAKEEEPGRKP